MIYEYLVMDDRYHYKGLDTDIAFATNDLDESILVANEIGFNSVVVRYDPDTEKYELVYNATFNADLPLMPEPHSTNLLKHPPTATFPLCRLKTLSERMRVRTCPTVQSSVAGLQ